MAPTKRELACPPLLTSVLISFRPLHIQHEPLKPTTDLAARGLPDLPMFMTVTGEYDVTSPDQSVEGAFFFQNVMLVGARRQYSRLGRFTLRASPWALPTVRLQTTGSDAQMDSRSSPGRSRASTVLCLCVREETT